MRHRVRNNSIELQIAAREMRKEATPAERRLWDALGVPLPLLLGFYPSAGGLFFLPTYGTVLAAVSFDQTGTTKIGKYLLNHSFMLPGLVTIFSTIIIALLLSKFVV